MNRYVRVGDLIIGYGSSYVFETLSGIETGSVRRNETQYVETDGSEISDVFFEPKTVEISGHIIARSAEEMERLKRQLIKAFNPKQKRDVFYCNGVCTYYAEAMGDGLPEFGKKYCKNVWILPFIAYMVIPKFYWLSESEIQTNIFKITNLITTKTTFPGVFSKKASISNVDNDGDVTAFPIIRLVCDKPNTSDVIIKNNTTEKQLKIKYTMSAGEVINVDMEEMTIISSINGNIINNISADSEFWGYECGINNVECATDSLHIISLHRNKYMGV